MAHTGNLYLRYNPKSRTWELGQQASATPVPIEVYILHHAHGGTDRNSAASVLAARRYAVRLARDRQGVSKYMPHQGVRERARRVR